MTPTQFLETIEKTMAMKPADFVEELLKGDEPFTIIDLRSADKVELSHIPTSLQCDLTELPAKAGELIPTKETTVIMVCNGSIQSAMAVMYLRCEGYANSYNMGGGFSSWEKNGRIIDGRINDSCTA